VLLFATGLIKAQTRKYTCNEHNPQLKGNLNEAKYTIARILNDKSFVVADSAGRIKYKYRQS